MSTLRLFCALLLFNTFVGGEPWFSIPLRRTTNNEHFVTKMAFGDPVQFYLDIIMDTGSGRFHLYPHSQNNHTRHNIKPSDTDSFECICQHTVPNSKTHTAYLIELNDSTWYQFEQYGTMLDSNDTNNSLVETYKPLLSGCPVFNESTCKEWSSQCGWTERLVYVPDIEHCEEHEIALLFPSNESNATNETGDMLCNRTVCSVQGNGAYGLLIDGETVTFLCDEDYDCFSGRDIVSFADVNDEDYNAGQYIPYFYAEGIALDAKGHNVSLYTNQSWADGLLGLVYEFNEVTAFWRSLGINEQHTALVAFDTLRGWIDVGSVYEDYEQGLIDYSENIWWNSNGYHYFYIYALSVCGIDIFDELDIGSYYLGMIDTGAACLTLPFEIFDLVFKYIPFGYVCDGNQTFCYIPSGLDEEALDEYDSFPMFSFRLNMNDHDEEHTFYISLKDLVITLSNDKGARYCIQRGGHSIEKIGDCTPDPMAGSNTRNDCTSHGIIIFGTKVLHSLYAVLDFPHKRMGFANNRITNYSRAAYESANAKTCKVIETTCVGDDYLNLTLNQCQSGEDQCKAYWGWTYDASTHFCVLETWLYVAIPLFWLFLIIVLLVYVKLKQWIDQNIFYVAIKV